jgi:HNH endonuclease
LPTWANRVIRRVRMGQAARRRIRAGGPRAKGRPAASTKEWTAIGELVKARAGWRCQACGLRTRLDVHHVVKRAQGGSDFELDRLVALCRLCHDQTDAPFSKGRLVVKALGGGLFAFDLVYAVSKWDARRAIAGAEDEPKPIPRAQSSKSAPITSLPNGHESGGLPGDREPTRRRTPLALA